MKKTLEEFEEISKNLKPIQKLWINLCQTKKCIWCNTKFKDGIIRKHPQEDVPINSYMWFNAEFLSHAQTTHGYSPDIIQGFLEIITNKI